MNSSLNNSLFVVRSEGRVCGLPLAAVIETMRPLAVQFVRDLPPFIRGLSVIRGTPVPVVELAVLLGDQATHSGRWVLLRVGDHRVVLAVSEVLAIRRIEERTLRAFPPLLDGAFSGLVTALEQRDRELLLVLQVSRLVPDEVWRQLAVSEGST